MAERCIFCGTKLGLFSGRTLACGGASQTVCGDCWNKLSDLSMEERARRALETGRAENADMLQAFLERAEARRKQAEQDRKDRQTDQRCLRCGGVMERFGRRHIHLGEEGLFGPVARDGIFVSWLTVDILRCAGCGKAEFYLPDPEVAPWTPEEPEKQKTVFCPVCGTQYTAGTQCPACARERARRAANTTRRKEEKPPWEK